MPSVIDETVVQALNVGFAKEAAGASDSRTRQWDNIATAIGVAQVGALSHPTVLAGQGIRMLNGTPGQFANAVPAGTTP